VTVRDWAIVRRRLLGGARRRLLRARQAVGGCSTRRRATSRDHRPRPCRPCERVNETVAGVNVELARVDTIVAGVQSITATTDQLVGVVHATVSNPLIKAAAFAAGGQGAGASDG
jgi:hypothetical protein